MQFAIEATGRAYAPIPNVVGIGESFSEMVANVNLNKVNIMAVPKNSATAIKQHVVNVQTQVRRSSSHSRVHSLPGSAASTQTNTRPVGSQQQVELCYDHQRSKEHFLANTLLIPFF